MNTNSILQHKLLTSTGAKTKYALQQGYVELPKKSYPNTYIYLSWGYGCFIIQGYKNDRRVYKELDTTSVVTARKILEATAKSTLAASPISQILHQRFPDK